MLVLIANTGSSSLKLRLLADDVVVRRADRAAGPDGVDVDDLADAIRDWERPDVVAHRIVHGGPGFSGPVLVDAEVRAKLRELSDLAPSHVPAALAVLDAVGELLPDVPAVAGFDTAFHTTIPAAAATYAIPLAWRERHAIRRYGFHGLSHAYAARRAAELLDRPPTGLRLVTCHLGSGASLAAVVDGRSVDTTMGFTPLDGLVMATRSGAVDPGLILWLQQHGDLSAHDVATALERRSGLLALAGSGDMREVEAAAAAGDEAAGLAIDVYVHRLAGHVAAMAAAVGGFDALVFTGGVGEHSPTIRRRAAARLGFLGVAVDERRNDAPLDPDGDRDITAAGADVRTLVITAREDLQLAGDARRLVQDRQPRGAP